MENIKSKIVTVTRYEGGFLKKLRLRLDGLLHTEIGQPIPGVERFDPSGNFDEMAVIDGGVRRGDEVLVRRRQLLLE